MSVLVLIVQTVTRIDEEPIKTLLDLFSDSYFTTQIITKTREMTDYDILFSVDSSLRALPVLIVYDTSFTYLCKSEMKTTIESILTKVQADVYFLSGWNERCDRFTSTSMSNIKKVESGTSTQANIYTNKVRSVLKDNNILFSEDLNNNIVNGNLIAVTAAPNIFNFNINLATNLLDVNKLNKCKSTQMIAPTLPITSTYIWFAVIVALTIILAWALIRVGPKGN